MGRRLAVDVGGTFVDFVLLDEETGKAVVEKEPSRIGAMGDHVFRAVERLGVDLADIGMMLHGSTVAINTVIQERGARVGLITTRGFRDVLELGRGNRPEVYNLLYKPPRPLVPRYLRFEVPERTSHRGEILLPLDEEAVRRAALELRRAGVEAVAVCFLHDYANPSHELRAREIVREAFPEAETTIASEITREWREYERTSTAVLNAYIMPRMRSYVGDLDRRLRESGFQGALNIIQSTGGMLSATESRQAPIRTLESGPAGGVVGAVALSRLIGRRDIIAADVGGTSFDVGLVLGGRPLEESQASVGGRPVLAPTIDIASVGAGGGSIARIDPAGGLRVGPESAEADPGPVCFGRGGFEPTVTDAHVVLGRIDPANFLGRRMRLDVESARRAIESRVAAPLGLSLEQAADGMTQLADTNMIHAIRRVTIERGHDPRSLSLLCYGGAGGLFAAALAADLRIGEAIVPPDPAVFSAWGILNADYREDIVVTSMDSLADLTPGGLLCRFDELARTCLDRLRSSGVETAAAVVSRKLDMRYEGQEHTVGVPVPEPATLERDGLQALVERFEALHERTYGHATPGHPTEVVNLRVNATVAVAKPSLAEIAGGGRDGSQAANGARRAYFREAGGWVETTVYERERLLADDRIPGPAIVQEWNATTVIGLGQTARVDRYGCLVIVREGKE